jgi:FixJ family two-component response regulator
MRGTICVAESDLIVRLDVVRLLEDAGFHVVDFDSADRALIHLRRHATGVIMILTAVGLPGIFDGPDLARIAAISWPRITVVVAKGMGSFDLDLPDVVKTVSKPFEDDDVLSYAFLAEKKAPDPANLDFEI